MTAAEDDEFWQFTLRFYALPGVADALIGLQDRHRLDVNLMLFAVWLGLSGRGRIDAAEVAAAEAAIAPLRAGVVEPLRALRRGLKDHPDAVVRRLRDAVKALELEAEKAVQQRLAARAGAAAGSPDPEAAAANLALCLGAAAAAAVEATAIRGGIAAWLRRPALPGL